MGLTYKWQVSTDANGSVFVDIPANSILYEGLNTNTLVLKSLTPEENAKKYRVIIGSTDFDVPPIVSRAATLFTVPTITLSSVNDVNTTTNTATFSVSGSSNTGTISYQWQKTTLCDAGVLGPCFVNLQDQQGSISGSTTSSLVLSNLVSNDNNTQYRVVASSQCCGTAPITKASNLATLQIVSPGQTVIITSNITDTIISNNSVTFNVSAQVSASQVTPTTVYPTVTFTWQKLTNGTWTNINGTSVNTTTDTSPSLRVFSQAFTISSPANNDQYRVIISDGRSSVTSAIAKSLTPTPCTNCGGSGTGDPHFYINNNYGFDDNPIANGHKEIVMLYIKNLEDNIEHILTCKNTGTFGSSSPYNVDRTTYIKKQNNNILLKIDNGRADMMGLVTVDSSPGRFSFKWSILEQSNINKIQNLNIIIGGAWYWMCKSLIQYLKKDPSFSKLGWPYVGWISADGIGIALAPYGLIREDFEIDNLRVVNASTNINGLYISHSRDKVSLVRYNKDNSAYSLIQDSGYWQISTRVLPSVSFKKISSSKFSIDFSRYLDGESLANNLGISSPSISGNPIISNITFTNSATGKKQENITAEITLSGGSVLTDGNATFGYFANTVSGVNTINMPSNFANEDFYIGQKIGLESAVSGLATITSVSGTTITLDQNLLSTGRFPIKLIYATSSETSISSPDLVSGWVKSDGSVNNIRVIKSVYSPEGLGKITENINENPRFWNELSLALNNKQLPTSQNPAPPQPNVIITHPKDTVSVNNTASFSVITSFPERSVYQWQKSVDKGVTWSNIANSNSSNLFVLNGERDSRYRVVVDGQTISQAAKLSVPSSLVVSSEPKDRSSVNLEAIFSVTATGVNPLVYRWEKSDDNGANYSPVPSGNLSSLTLLNLKAEDDGDLYRVVIQDGAGDKYTSAGSKLTINPKLTVVTQPTNQTASLSETATFQVSGICDNGNLKYQWEVSSNNGIKYSNYGDLSANGILNLSGLTVSDDNKLFRAKLISDIKNNSIYSNSARLFVPNTIIISGQPSNAISISGTASFSVDASTSNPPLYYQWQKSSAINGLYTDIISATGSTLNLNNLTLSDDNTYYRVELKDERGLLYSNPVYVDTTPQISITQNLNSEYIIDGYDTSLSVNGTTTDGILYYSWEKSDPGSTTFVPVTGVDINTIYLSLRPSDSGVKYRSKLSVEGARSAMSNTATILVNPKSIFINKSLPISRKINYPNTSIELSVEASSKYLPLNYQWQVSKTDKDTFNYQLTNNDIFYDNIGLYLDMNGVSGSKVFVDSSKNKIPVGLYRNNDLYMTADISLSNSSFKSSPTSVKFNDIYSHMRILDTDNNLKLSNKNFTIEYWYRPTEYADMAGISRRLNKSWPDYGNNGWVISSTKFRAKIGSTWKDDWIDDSLNLENITLNEWHHIALSRHNNTYRMFRDGILIGSFTNGDSLDESAPYIIIGASSSTSLGSVEDNYSVIGFMDNVKITIGVAKYLSSFIPDAQIDNTYDFIYNNNRYENIPNATGTVLLLDNLNYTNNLEKYRVIIQDSVSTIVVEE